jgi:hypothetical protein
VRRAGARDTAARKKRPALPTRGNSRSPSPSFCSPVIGPLNLSSAASRTRFIPKPCAGRWNVPGFGSRAGARNCSVGSRSCMACLSRQREHSSNGQGRTRAPPAARRVSVQTACRRQADAPTDRARRLPQFWDGRHCGRWDDIDLTTGRLHVRRAKGGITTVHPISAKKSQALLRRLQRETKTASPYVFVSERRRRPEKSGDRIDNQLGHVVAALRGQRVARPAWVKSFFWTPGAMNGSTKVRSSQANSGCITRPIGTTQGRPAHDQWAKLR